MVSRYDNQIIGKNKTEIYSKFLEERNLNHIKQYFTIEMHHPSDDELRQIQIIGHEWKVGDRYYKLADKYYGDAKLWYIIAHYNQKPTESHLQLGDVIDIPMPLERVIEILRY
jgi:hypothetical protein